MNITQLKVALKISDRMLDLQYNTYPVNYLAISFIKDRIELLNKLLKRAQSIKRNKHKRYQRNKNAKRK